MPEASHKRKHQPERTCAACRKQAARGALVRWVRGEDGHVVPDLRQSSFGRGAWLHPTAECLKKLPTSLAKSFKAPVATTTPEALLLLKQAAEHRAHGLLGQARRQGLAIFGADQTRQAWAAGRVELVLVASDARATASLDFLREASDAGQLRVYSTKATLGALFGRGEIGVVGVQDRGLARELFGAIALALLVQDAPFQSERTGQEIFVSSEVE